MIEDLKMYAVNTFKAINARGVARIDFLIDDKTKKIYVSEINTMPGSLSLYLWLPKKKSQTELINDLINIAIEEYKSKNNLVLAFENNLLDKFDILNGKKTNKIYLVLLFSISNLNLSILYKNLKSSYPFNNVCLTPSLVML